MKKIINAERMNELVEAAIKALTDNTVYGSAWFETEEKAEEWMGDCFFDALLAVLEELGFEIKIW